MRASPYLSVGVSSARLNSCSVTPFAPLPPSTLEILPEKYFSRSAPHGSRTINTLRPLPPPPPSLPENRPSSSSSLSRVRNESDTSFTRSSRNERLN